MMTSRSLGWLGCSGVLAIGLFLPVPLQAQDSGKKESRGIILQLDGKPGVIFVQDRSPDQELMELLQRALKILARKTQAPSADKVEEIKKAKKQVEALLRERELVEARLRQAQARLAQLQGKSGTGMPLQFKLQFQPAPGQKKPPAPKAKGIGIFSQDLELRIQDGKILAAPGKAAKRVGDDDLQNRLDRLRRELEELSRDIQQLRSQKK
jgi:hypothetical protein